MFMSSCTLKVNINARTHGNFMFMEVVRHASCYQSLRQRSSSAAAALLYASSEEKCGCIISNCSPEAHRDSVVQPQWMLNIMGMGKMSVEAARSHFVRRCRDLPRILASIDAFAEERRRIGMEKHMKGTVM